MKTIVAIFLFSLTSLLCYSTEIDRMTFSVSLPDKWVENTNDNMYNPNGCIFFEGPQSTFVFVMIGKKSAEASVDKLVKNQKTAQARRFQDAKVTETTKWSNYNGKGFKMDGKVIRVFDGQLTVLGFEKGDSVCLIEEYAMRNDCKKFAEDFEKIRKTFKLK